MKLSKRQRQIVDIVKQNQPISGNDIAQRLGLSRATLRNDLSLLTMLGMLDAKPKVGYCYVTDTSITQLYSKLYETAVEEIMRETETIHINSTIQDAVASMFIHDTGSLYVVSDNEKLAGIVSRKDLLRVAMSGVYNQDYPAAMYMTRMPNVVTTTKTETILDVLTKMINHEIDSLPVLDSEQQGRIIGRISKTTIVHFFTEIGLSLNKDRE